MTGQSVVKGEFSGAWAKYLPLVALHLFMLATLTLFAFGGWDWPVNNPVGFYSLVLTFQAAHLIGYLVGIRLPSKGYFWRLDPVKLLKWGLALELLLLIPTMIDIVSSGASELLTAIASPAEAYYGNQASGSGPGFFIPQIRFLLSPLLYPVMPLGIFYWERLSRALRIGLVLAIVSEILSWLLIGTNKGLVDAVTLIPLLIFARIFSGKTKLSRRKLITLLTVIAVGFTLVITYFTRNIVERLGGAIPDTYVGTQIYRKQDGLTPYVPEPLIATYLASSAYAGSGYYGLYLSTQLPFQSTYGLGHSMYLSQFAKDSFGAPYFYDESYPGRVQSVYGWSQTVRWHTMYSWWASDISFWGIPILMLVFGIVTALVWADVRKGDNPFAVIMFTHFATMFLYVSANNQAVAFSDVVLAFYVHFGCWILSRKKILTR